MKKLFLFVTILIMSIAITTSTAFAAKTVTTWRAGSGSFSQSVTSPVFYVGRVDGRSQKEGINELDMEYKCASTKTFIVTLYTRSGQKVADSGKWTCTKNGGVHNSFSAWMPVKHTGSYYLKFSSVKGSGTLVIKSYRYYYFKP